MALQTGVETKTCRDCRRDLPLDAFPKNGVTQSGRPSRRPACPDCYRVELRKRREANPEIHKSSQARYRAKLGMRWAERNRLWREANPDYYEQNLERSRLNGRKKAATRRARLAGVVVENVDPQRVYERDEGICGICHEPVGHGEFTIDHVVPLARGGEHSYANVQVAHSLCNSRKGTS